MKIWDKENLHTSYSWLHNNNLNGLKQQAFITSVSVGHNPQPSRCSLLGSSVPGKPQWRGSASKFTFLVVGSTQFLMHTDGPEALVPLWRPEPLPRPIPNTTTTTPTAYLRMQTPRGPLQQGQLPWE